MTTTDLPARDRILAAASHRYYADGIRAASADRLLADAGVSKVTFYRHFPTKDDLVVAYLQQQADAEEQRIADHRAAHAGDPAATLRWYAGAVGEVACGPGFRGCPFINAAAELADADHPGRKIIARHRAWMTDQARELLTQLGVADAGPKAEALMMLRDGAMVASYVGSTPETVTACLVSAATTLLARA